MTRSQVPARLLVGLVLDAVAIVAFVAVPVEPASTAAILALAATAMAASASGLRNLPSGWLPDCPAGRPAPKKTKAPVGAFVLGQGSLSR